MSPRIVSSCLACGTRKVKRGATRCAKHPIGRPKGSAIDLQLAVMDRQRNRTRWRSWRSPVAV